MAEVYIREGDYTTSPRSIETSVGALNFFTIDFLKRFTIDEDRVIVDFSMPNYIPVSIISYNNVCTPFTFSRGGVEMSYTSDGTFTITGTAPYTVKSEDTNTIIAFVPYMFSTLDGDFAFYSIMEAVPVSRGTISSTPTENSFGVFTYNTDWTGLYGGTITTSTIETSNAIMGGGSQQDPYEPGGYAGRGWGTGNFDATSDTIGMPALPTVSAIDTGFLTLFTPSLAQLQSFQEYLWSDLLEGIKDGSLTDIVDSLKKIVSDPYQAIMGLSIVPVAVPTAGSKDVKMYGVLDSGVVMPYASTQWIEVNCGSLNVNEFWGNYMDYAPYTKITSLYLPFVGVVSVDVDEIMGKTVTIKYRVDILSGQCIAFIIINGSVEYQYQGHCATSLPITASDFSSTINAGLNLISHVTAGVAGIAGGAISGALTGGIGGAVGAVGAAASAANNIASDVMNAKPNIKAGSSVGGAGGLLSVKKPYFIAIRPKQCVATYQKSFTGFPINETYAIRQLTGYTEFERINLDGIPLTQPEKEELEGLLMGGVYL